MKHLILTAALTLVPGIALADNIGGTTYSGPPILQCSDAYCTAECGQVASSAGNSSVARRCASACATTNHAAGGTTPGGYMAQCLAENTKNRQCADELMDLIPVGSAPSGSNLYQAFDTLYGGDGACAKM